MFTRLWLQYYEKEPVLACLLLGAALVVPAIPVALLVIDAAIFLISGIIAIGIIVLHVFFKMVAETES